MGDRSARYLSQHRHTTGAVVTREDRPTDPCRRVRARRVAVGIAMAAAAGLVAALPAAATTGTATISAGSLAFVSSPPNVSWLATLNGLDQTPTTTQAIDVGDATGSGTGWNITATSTTFTAGSHTLSTSATTVTAAPTVACDARRDLHRCDERDHLPVHAPRGGHSTDCNEAIQQCRKLRDGQPDRHTDVEVEYPRQHIRRYVHLDVDHLARQRPVGAIERVHVRAGRSGNAGTSMVHGHRMCGPGCRVRRRRQPHARAGHEC